MSAGTPSPDGWRDTSQIFDLLASQSRIYRRIYSEIALHESEGRRRAMHPLLRGGHGAEGGCAKKRYTGGQTIHKKS